MATSQALIISLKSILKSNGITYAAVAKKINVTETSVKRLMSGQTPMTLDRLDQICEVAGIDFMELLRITKPTQQSEPDELSFDQESLLAGNEDLFLTFYCLIKGLTVEGILQKYRISETRLQSSLHKLEKAQLLELHPKNKIKFLVSRTVRWRQAGPLSQKYENALITDFLGNSFDKSNELRKFLTFPITDRSKNQIARKFRELISELQVQSEMDTVLEKGLKSTVTVLIGFRDWTPNLLNKYLK